MPSVFESVTDLLAQGDTMSRLGGAIGTDTSNTQRAVQAAAPALLGGMADRVEQPGGLQAITKLLDRTDASPDVGVDKMLLSDGSQGRGMLDDLFGADHGDLFSGLASKASVSSGSMARLLPMLAPMVMGLLAKRRAAEQLSPDGVIGLLQAERQEMRRSGVLGAVGAGVAGAGAAGAMAVGATAAGAAAGGVKTPVRNRPMVPSPDEPSGGRFGWLKWLIGAIVVVALLAWALSQCGGSEELSGVTEAVEDVADDAAVIVDDAAEDVDDLAEDATDAAGEAVDAVTGVDLQPDVDAALSGAGIAGLAGVIDADGVVTLSGEVGDDDAKAAAEAAVMGVDGVTAVNNGIIVAAAEAEDTDDANTDDANTDEEADAPASGATINDLLDLDPITFAVNSAEITADGKAVLAAAVEFMNGNPDVNVEIGGHTDSDGNDAFNQELSQSRADSVKAFLESEGVDGERMATKGYGEAEPKVDNDTDENKAINRRIEFTIQ